MVSVLCGLPALSPAGTVFDDPISQSALEADVVPDFFGLDPFMLQDFLALGLELTVKRGILN